MSDLIEKALGFATWAHEGQTRKGGGGIPYITHPVAVYEQLVAHGETDEVTLAVALLHDTVEDCKDKGVTLDLIEESFGPEVALGVSQVTDEPGLSKTKAKKAQVAKAPTMCLPAKKTKLSDKTHNVRSIKENPPGWSPEAVRGYVESAKAVVRALGPVNESLEAAFFVACDEALATVS